MAYIGRGVDKISNIEVLDAITFTNSAGPYNLLKDTVAFTPTSPERFSDFNRWRSSKS